MKTKIDYNSTINQKIKELFVQRNVLTCFSYEMESVLKVSNHTNNMETGLPSYDDIENGFDYVCPCCSEPLPESDELKEGKEKEFICSSCKEEFSDPDTQPQEIYEWWIVTDHLCDKLRKQGEAVLEWGNNYYWGRTTTGQSIMLDHVISVICEEMEILDGQKYSLAKNTV